MSKKNKNKNKTNNQLQPQNITQPENIIQTEQSVPNVSNSNNVANITIPMVYMPEAQYKSMNNERILLAAENDKLHTEIDILRKDMMTYCENERLLKETIKHNEQTIEELREENKKLKIEIEQLKKQLKEQEIKLEEQTLKLKKQETLIDKLNKRLDDKESVELFKKFSIAIQDINHDDSLENKLNYQSKQNLIKLKKNRISNCHYLDSDYTISEKNERRTFFLDKVKNIPQEIKAKFDKMYPKLLENIEKYIAPQPAILTQQMTDEINLWWE